MFFIILSIIGCIAFSFFILLLVFLTIYENWKRAIIKENENKKEEITQQTINFQYQSFQAGEIYKIIKEGVFIFDTKEITYSPLPINTIFTVLEINHINHQEILNKKPKLYNTNLFSKEFYELIKDVKFHLAMSDNKSYYVQDAYLSLGYVEHISCR